MPQSTLGSRSTFTAAASFGISGCWANDQIVSEGSRGQGVTLQNQCSREEPKGVLPMEGIKEVGKSKRRARPARGRCGEKAGRTFAPTPLKSGAK